MATQIVSVSSVEIGIRLTPAGGDGVLVAAGVLLASINKTAILAYTDYHFVTISGEVYGMEGGVYLGGDGHANEFVLVRAGGAVTSEGDGVFVGGRNSTVTNFGTISGHSAVSARGAATHVVNHGEIIGLNGGYGVVVGQYASAPGQAALTDNFGTITSDLNAYYGDLHYRDILRNYGAMVGNVQMWDGDDLFVNRGTLLGETAMGIGNDRLDNTGGRIDGPIHLDTGEDLFLNLKGTVLGTVYGDAGNDTMFGNAEADDILDGGTGFDLLDFRKGGAAIVALDLAFDNAGAALGDAYTGFEALFGSITGGDRLRGDGAANALFGFGGNDRLEAMSGTDTLRGGEGIDTLTGGLGNDNFRFETLAEVGDIITDFRNLVGDDDRFQIKGAAFGGLATGALAATAFQTRADNLAQDADDRFIFRTTDHSLWFDADGTGSTAAVLVADLQTGATLTAADILIY